MLASINWPDKYLPGLTDNFCSNEIVVVNLPLRNFWDALRNAMIWPTYYSNSSDVSFEEKSREPYLYMGCKFSFKTFGFPIKAEIIEFVSPDEDKVARMSWHGWAEGDEDHRLDVVHAWLMEDLSKNRVRILTQESQLGKPARELAKEIPNPMINGHQAWLDGMKKYVSQSI